MGVAWRGGQAASAFLLPAGGASRGGLASVPGLAVHAGGRSAAAAAPGPAAREFLNLSAVSDRAEEDPVSPDIESSRTQEVITALA